MPERWQPAEGLPGEQVPNPARMYDTLLGGNHNFPADRRLVEQLVAAEPGLPYWARANRAFLARAVRYLARQGVRQFLDIGSGLPTVGNVHEIAAQHAPDARVVYADIDPVAVAFSQGILTGTNQVVAVQGDLREPDTILTHPDVRQLIDFDQPVAVLLVAILHFVTDADNPHTILARIRAAVPAGSYLVISHATEPADMNAEQVRATRDYSTQAAPLTLRSKPQVVDLFDGWHLVEPGVCGVAFWHPEPHELQTPDEISQAERIPGWVGVARKPE